MYGFHSSWRPSHARARARARRCAAGGRHHTHAETAALMLRLQPRSPFRKCNNDSRPMPRPVVLVALMSILSLSDSSSHQEGRLESSLQGSGGGSRTRLKSEDKNWPTQCWANGTSVPCGGQQQQCGPLFSSHDGPSFHVRDASCGVNDPNGPFYFNGIYHLFYQVLQRNLDTHTRARATTTAMVPNS